MSTARQTVEMFEPSPDCGNLPRTRDALTEALLLLMSRFYNMFTIRVYHADCTLVPLCIRFDYIFRS